MDTRKATSLKHTKKENLHSPSVSMASFRDLRRLVDGLSLVADELLKSSQAIHAAKSGDLSTLISSSLKKALVSATDLAGITKGKVREFSYPSPKETVVHFSDHSDRRDESVVLDSQTSSSIKDEVVEAELESLDEKIEEIGFELDKSEEGRLEALREQHDVDIGSLIEKSEIDSKDLRENADTSEIAVAPVTKRKPRERRVPSTPFSRAFGFAGLGAQLMVGTAQDYATKLLFGTPASEENQSGYSAFLSKKNAERLALALCRMRGAALKLGQMLSIQDESLVPAPILSALEIVRQGADVMPRSQLNQVISSELGPDWPSKLRSFDYEPMAAASIGQVHRAVTKDGLDVAIKIQYPGVADSIESDLENVRRLLDYTNLIPKGLYLDRAMKVAKEELSRECNYELEATSQKRFRELLCDTEGFYVPVVIDDISSRKVLTTELVSGIPIDKVTALNQETRDYVGKKLLELTLKELFLFRFMQTDPNWSNFLYDDAARMINLIDFGAAREYPQGFVDDYLRMVLACANCDRDGVIQMSQRLGFLTGMESEVMLEAHVQAGFIIGMPFSKPGGYNFRLSNITNSISTLGATMLKHRLSPPPDEAYSLHRKLSGAFLACIKLGAVVPCREVLLQVYEQYQYIDHGAEVVSSSTA